MQFATLVKSRIDSGEINHLSVFALAPIPLLIELGRLLGDIAPADVYQLHREPAGLPWAKTGLRICYETTTPTNKSGPVALELRSQRYDHRRPHYVSSWQRRVNLEHPHRGSGERYHALSRRPGTIPQPSATNLSSDKSRSWHDRSNQHFSRYRRLCRS